MPLTIAVSCLGEVWMEGIGIGCKSDNQRSPCSRDSAGDAGSPGVVEVFVRNATVGELLDVSVGLWSEKSGAFLQQSLIVSSLIDVYQVFRGL